MTSFKPQGFSHNLYLVIIQACLLVLVPFLHFPVAQAHELRPAILDIGIVTANPDQLTINLTFSGEAFLADIDLSTLSDTDDSSKAGAYDDLRAVPAAALADRISASFPDLTDNFAILLGGRRSPVELLAVNVDSEADLRMSRDTTVEMRTRIPNAGEIISVQWAPYLGPLLIRQMGDGSDPGYADYLVAGGISAGFGLTGALTGAGPTSAASVMQKYVHSGIIHIIPAGLDHIVFIIGLLAYGLSARGLIFQVSLFTIAHTLTLAMASLGWIQVSASIVEPLIALSIAWIGIENICRNSGRLAASRSVVVFAFGLLHGLGFASVLADFGLPQDAFILGLLSFNIGVEIGQLLIVVPIYLALRVISLSQAQFRNGFQLPVSGLIAAVGIFWFAERTGLL